MPTITVKNIPDDVYRKLKRSAELSRRSINSEIIVCIEQAVSDRGMDTETIVANARRLRSRTADKPITDREFSKAKAAGRP